MQLRPTIRSATRTLAAFARTRPVFTGIAALAIGGAVVAASLGNPPAPETPARVPQVTVRSVAALSGDTAPLSLTGEVRSQSEARLQAERAGRIVRVSVAAGDTVRAGAILAEIENAAERAQVVSARGSLEAAEAALAKLVAGDRPEEQAATEVSLQSANQTLSQARTSAVTAFRQGYAAAQAAVEANADALFRDAETINPKLIPTTREFATSEQIERQRVALEQLLREWEAETGALGTDDDLSAALARAQSRLERVNSFLDDLSAAVAAQTDFDVPQATIDAQQAIVAAARAAANGGLASLAQARTALAGAVSAQAQAQSNVAIDAAGPRAEDLAAQRASVTQARGAYQAALANLEKTIIRTPITGTVNTLSVNAGEYVAPQQPVAIVSNNGALQIEAFVTAPDRAQISIGNTVAIDGRDVGVVTNIAPGLDPVTNKIKVEIGVTDTAASLTHGDTVRLSIARDTVDRDNSPREIVIPITALKVETDRTVVFTVSKDSILVAHPVAEGALLGSGIIIEEGVTPDMAIVLDARGLNEGDSVIVAEN